MYKMDFYCKYLFLSSEFHQFTILHSTFLDALLRGIYQSTHVIDIVKIYVNMNNGIYVTWQFSVYHTNVHFGIFGSNWKDITVLNL